MIEGAKLLQKLLSPLSFEGGEILRES